MTIYQFFASATKIYYCTPEMFQRQVPVSCRANKTRKGKYNNNNFFKITKMKKQNKE
jgi:hypothetical protein